MTAPAPRSPHPPGLLIRFGQVWESPDEAIGSLRYLVVSSDAYNTTFGDRRVGQGFAFHRVAQSRELDATDVFAPGGMSVSSSSRR